MTHTELWLTYHMTSRAYTGKPATSQLIELEFQNNKLVDLEDVLDYVFHQGFVEARHRPSTWWENTDGDKIKSCHAVEDLLEQGFGLCPTTALRLVIEDIPPAIWFSYAYLHNAAASVVTQRVKFDDSVKLEKLAHLTNHIFTNGYLPAKLRAAVHWQGVCGKRLQECANVYDVLLCGEGVSEDKAIRLIIDDGCHVHTPVAEAPRCPKASSCGEGVSEDKTIRLIIDDGHHAHHHAHTCVAEAPRCSKASCSCGESMSEDKAIHLVIDDGHHARHYAHIRVAEAPQCPKASCSCGEGVSENKAIRFIVDNARHARYAQTPITVAPRCPKASFSCGESVSKSKAIRFIIDNGHRAHYHVQTSAAVASRCPKVWCC